MFWSICVNIDPPPPVPEFLESFFLKYGSFIPLSETDVLEHLKTKTNLDLSKRRVCTHAHARTLSHKTS